MRRQRQFYQNTRHRMWLSRRPLFLHLRFKEVNVSDPSANTGDSVLNADPVAAEAYANMIDGANSAEHAAVAKSVNMVDHASDARPVALTGVS
jgi:hypothetical protein